MYSHINSQNLTEYCKWLILCSTVFNINDFEARPELDGTRTSTFILLNFTKSLAIIGGTRYGGENKKTIFGVLNFIFTGMVPE